VYCTGGFHGNGLGALSVMGHARWQRPFQPLLPECYAVPFGDVAALESVVLKHKIAGMVVEPILGEGGVVFPDEGYLADAQRVCVKHGALFMLDEVQTGLCRTGRWFAHEHTPDLNPDVLILGKALGAGLLPVAATLTRRHLHDKAYGNITQFDLHGSTYAGYALGCIVALETLRILEEDNLCEVSFTRGESLVTKLRARIGDHPLVKDVRGQGLLVALELGNTASWGSASGLLSGLRQALVPKAILCQWLSVRLLELGFVCQPASQEWNVLKLTPPLIVSDADIDRLVAAIGELLDTYRSLPKLTKDVVQRFGSQFLSGWKFG
jgi:putrescine aminotransferase